jgi:predicted ester cyclase
MTLGRRHILTLVALGASAALPLGRTALAAAPGDDAVAAALLERYVAAFNAHDVEAFADIVAADYVQHNGRFGSGLAALQGGLRGYFAMFPDMHIAIEDRIIGGDKLVARTAITATHSQTVQLGPGTPSFPPTGKKLAWGGIEIWRVAKGRLAEHWDQDDLLGLARQLRGDS